MNREKIEKLFKDPKYYGKLENPKYTAKAVDLKKGDILYLEVNEKDKYIEDVKYKIFNKSIAFAICEVISEKIVNQDINYVLDLVDINEIEEEIGKIDKNFIYEIDLYKKALNDIVNEYKESKVDSTMVSNSVNIKRLLNFGKEDDIENLSKEQVQKLLDAVDDLNYIKDIKEKNKAIEKIKEEIISGKKQPKVTVNTKAIQLLKDDVPDFSAYKDNTVNLSFNDYMPQNEDENIDSSTTFDFTEEDKILDFSNYSFDDKDKW